MQNLFNLKPQDTIKVIGVGDAGNSIINQIAREGISDLELIYADMQCFGRKEIGRAIAGANLLIIVAGLGGETGTKAAPLIGEIAKTMGIVTIGVFSLPLEMEGVRRNRRAVDGVIMLEDYVDAVAVIPNQNLIDYLDPHITISGLLAELDKIFATAVRSIVAAIRTPDYFQADITELASLFQNRSVGLFGTGWSTGEHRVTAAIEQAVNGHLRESDGLSKKLLQYDDNYFDYTECLLIGITTDDISGLDLNNIRDFGDARVFIGCGVDESLHDEAFVTAVRFSFAIRLPKPRIPTQCLLNMANVNTDKGGSYDAKQTAGTGMAFSGEFGLLGAGTIFKCFGGGYFFR